MPRRSRRAARRLRNPSRRLCERDRRQQSEENADDDPNFSHSSSSSSRSALNGCSASANSKHGKNARQEIVGKKSGLHQGVRKKVWVSSNRLNRSGEAGRAPDLSAPPAGSTFACSVPSSCPS